MIESQCAAFWGMEIDEITLINYSRIKNLHPCPSPPPKNAEYDAFAVCLIYKIDITCAL